MLTTGRGDADRFHEECGVFGVFGHPDAAALAALGLHALQHRGQEAAGIVAYDGEQFNAHRGMGLVSDNFSSKVFSCASAGVTLAASSNAKNVFLIEIVSPLISGLQSPFADIVI